MFSCITTLHTGLLMDWELSWLAWLDRQNGERDRPLSFHSLFFFNLPITNYLSIDAIFNSWQAPPPFKHPSLILKSRKATFVYDGSALDWPNGFQARLLSRILNKLKSDSDRDIFPWGTLRHVIVRQLIAFLLNYILLKAGLWWSWGSFARFYRLH